MRSRRRNVGHRPADACSVRLPLFALGATAYPLARERQLFASRKWLRTSFETLPKACRSVQSIRHTTNEAVLPSRSQTRRECESPAHYAMGRLFPGILLARVPWLYR